MKRSIRIVGYDKHIIKVEDSFWGKETILYGKKIVSQKWSLFGSTHTFSVSEEGKEANYKVKIGMTLRNLLIPPILHRDWYKAPRKRYYVIARRNGVIIYSDK
jgi:hypothetical protein